MTQEEKQLLLKDLCARLFYGVKVQAISVYGYTIQASIDGYCSSNNKFDIDLRWRTLDEFKPYLRPMSSMTTEEEYEYHQCKNIDYLEICEMEHREMLKTTSLCFSRATDWLNKKGFDYRGLIEKGLALEAPEGMYKTK